MNCTVPVGLLPPVSVAIKVTLSPWFEDAGPERVTVGVGSPERDPVCPAKLRGVAGPVAPLRFSELVPPGSAGYVQTSAPSPKVILPPPGKKKLSGTVKSGLTMFRAAKLVVPTRNEWFAESPGRFAGKEKSWIVAPLSDLRLCPSTNCWPLTEVVNRRNCTVPSALEYTSFMCQRWKLAAAGSARAARNTAKARMKRVMEAPVVVTPRTPARANLFPPLAAGRHPHEPAGLEAHPVSDREPGIGGIDEGLLRAIPEIHAHLPAARAPVEVARHHRGDRAAGVAPRPRPQCARFDRGLHLRLPRLG